ncbi:MAG: hypothetical protein EXQ55_06095 [Acidobacteria bacterium]|nr:hypothetical protein [Acidobacteriota bacterium]
MSNRLRWLALGALTLALAAPLGLRAQGNPDPLSFKFQTGQDVVPIYEGWSHNPDGSYEMHFGYINRNYVETVVVPVGVNNRFTPGLPDRSQPTVFGPRIRRMQFSVTVPSDWAKRELVWTVTANGGTEKAVGWLQMEWEIDPVYFGKFRDEDSKKNTPPMLMVNVPAMVGLTDTLKLAATVTDDGLPKPNPPPPARGQGSNDPPTLAPLPNQMEVPVNVPQVSRGGRGGGGGGQAAPRLNVNWVVWRGPADVKFSAATTPIKDQKIPAEITANFAAPGTYILRATATDGELKVVKDFTVVVK